MDRNRIVEYIDSHKEEMLSDISRLCRINSEKAPAKEGKPFGEGAFLALKEALLMAEGYGFKVTNYDNYVGTADLNGFEKQLDILAHLDVVPAGDGWKITNPFEPLVEDGRIYGRGTADDKGPAVAALYAMRAVKELGIPLKKNVRLILGTDEECGSQDIEHYYRIEQEAPMTFSPDASFPVINVEKGSLSGKFSGEFELSNSLPRIVSVTSGTKSNIVPGKAEAVIEGITADVLEQKALSMEQEIGIRFQIRWESENLAAITAIGQGAHASTPEDGKNALTGLLTFLHSLPFAPCGQITMLGELLKLMPHGDWTGEHLGIAMEDDLSGKLTLAFSMFYMDSFHMEGIFDSRCPICATTENVLHVVKKRMLEAGLVLKNDSMNQPHYVPADSDFIRVLLKNYEEFTGRKGECQASGGGTYVHHLKNGVAFGASLPETDNHMHGADEFAIIEELVLCAKIFASVIVELCS